MGVHTSGIAVDRQASSTYAGVFIGAIGTAHDNGGDIVILKPTENVKEIFKLLGLDVICTIKESREEALRVFK